MRALFKIMTRRGRAGKSLSSSQEIRKSSCTHWALGTSCHICFFLLCGMVTPLWKLSIWKIALNMKRCDLAFIMTALPVIVVLAFYPTVPPACLFLVPIVSRCGTLLEWTQCTFAWDALACSVMLIARALPGYQWNSWIAVKRHRKECYVLPARISRVHALRAHYGSLPERRL